jgi:hypothetical protein
VVAIVVAVVWGAVLVVDKNKPAGSSEVFLESAGSIGANPFTPSVATPQPPNTDPGLAPAAASSGAPQSPSAAPAAVRTVSGGEPGLYGGTRNLTSCDTGLLINYLAQNPDKGAAWAGVLGITPPQIPDYVKQLTPVLLRADTRVTNHGFANGKAYALQSVLQAGTAVLVDKGGVPRVRCECGNPLLEPVPSASHYVGQPWAGFNQSTFVIVQTVLVINYFVLVDWGCGCYFARYPGGGPPDGPPCRLTTTTTPTTPPTSTESETTPPLTLTLTSTPVTTESTETPPLTLTSTPGTTQSETTPPPITTTTTTTTCPSGYRFSFTDGQCVPDVPPQTSNLAPPPTTPDCGPSREWDPISEQCIKP